MTEGRYQRGHGQVFSGGPSVREDCSGRNAVIPWRQVHRLIERQDKRWLLMVAVVLELLIGWIDHATGARILFAAYYFLPIALAAWYVSDAAAYVLACIAVVLRVLVFGESISGHMASVLLDAWACLVIFGVGAFIHNQLRHAIDRLASLNACDDLTGVCSRRHFMESLSAETERAFRHGYPLTVVFLDLDNFKAFNDRLGHNKGDALLVLVAGQIGHALREGDAVGRLGGDEFGVILPNTNAEQADAVLKRIHQYVAEATWQFGVEGVAVTASIGAVVYRAERRVDGEALMALADRQMYAVKNAAKSGSRIAFA